MIKISVTGVKEIDNCLRQLPLAVSHKVLSSAHAEAAKPLILKEQLLAPEGPTGNLVDSIGAIKISLAKANSVGEVRVGPRRRGRYKGFAGHLVEFGTKQRRTKRSGANRGIMPKKPFAKPAFEQTKGQVESLITQSIAKSLVRTMRRTLRK